MHFGLRERHALAGAVIRDDLLHLRDHLALAGRSAHMRAKIEIGEELALELEHGNLKPLAAEDLAARVLKFRYRSDVHLAHDRGSSIASLDGTMRKRAKDVGQPFFTLGPAAIRQ